MNELKACPFCGGDADFFTENFGKVVWVQCTICGVKTSQYETSEIVDDKNGKAWARTTWNRRSIVRGY